MVLWMTAMFCTVAAGGMRESFASALVQGRVKADSGQVLRSRGHIWDTFPTRRGTHFIFNNCIYNAD
jgi:hypothetical protein